MRKSSPKRCAESDAVTLSVEEPMHRTDALAGDKNVDLALGLWLSFFPHEKSL